jgi:hypothetical protein
MLARTHGQTASPTTMGKELAVFAHRLSRQIRLVWPSTRPAPLHVLTNLPSSPACPWLPWAGLFAPCHALILCPPATLCQLNARCKSLSCAGCMAVHGCLVARAGRAGS